MANSFDKSAYWKKRGMEKTQSLFDTSLPKLTEIKNIYKATGKGDIKNIEESFKLIVLGFNGILATFDSEAIAKAEKKAKKESGKVTNVPTKKQSN